MSGTKIDIIRDAYSQLRISGLTVQPTPEDLNVALYRLENMAAELDLNIDYNFEDNPDVNSPHNVQRRFWHGLATNLAVRLVDFGKTIPIELQRQANQAYSNMLSASYMPQQIQAPSRHPRGSGNTIRYNYGYRYYRPVERAPNTPQTNRMVVGDVDDFVESFASYLDQGETISSYTIEADDGLKILSDSLSSPNVNYRIEAENTTTDNSAKLIVQIVATTSNSRVETRDTFFTVDSA